MRRFSFTLTFPLVLVSPAAPAALSVFSDFEGGSARVLSLDATNQAIQISPAGDVQRGMPNWWSLRIDGIDPHKPLTLEVVALDTPVANETQGQTAPLNPGWTLPTRAAVSTNGAVWTQPDPGKRDGRRGVSRRPATTPTLWLAGAPPFTPRDAA